MADLTDLLTEEQPAPDPAPASPDPRIRLEAEALPVLNFALQQNGIPLLQSITVANNSDSDILDAVLTFSAEPEICLPLSVPVSCIPAHSRFAVRKPELQLNGQFLSEITEKITGLLTVTLSAEAAPLAVLQTELTALAFDEWQGSGMYPELLSAFVTPNHPELVPVIARASQLLEKWTGDPSLDGYQSADVNRVLRQAAAVYGALQEQNIVYAVPPASFETAGQRVRLCDAVLRQKMGTCLDLTLLYASCLEAMGLYPLLILKKSHIFAGVWLEDATFAEAVQDDPSVLTKRMAEGVSQIAAVECTALTAGRYMDFSAAREAARAHFAAEEPVAYIIDVRRARISGIHPLPVRVLTEKGWTIQRPELREKDLTAAPERVGVLDVEEQAQTPETRRSYWERKLLDLGLRNSLINLRMSRSMVPILATSLDELENALSDGSDFSILARPADWKPEQAAGFDTLHELGGTAPLIQSEFKNRRLRSVLTDAELEKSVKELYRTARTALEENGANTLYLALGLLRWFETPHSTKPRYAPLILIPVEMVRRSAAQGYSIRLRDEEPQMNITLLEKLKQDYHIVIPGLDPLPLDEHGVDTRRVFTVIRKAVMVQKNWDVLESAYLGIFSFSQFVMWNDIRNRSDDLAKNKIVRSLMEGKLVWDAGEMSPESDVSEDGVLLPLSADASQLYAIKAACAGESFVLHGPPGTGKSQTITALIANALAQGKTVLFVAEKMAALEVVQKRLDKIGIGAFCLELHSNKSRKKDVLEQLRQATEVTRNQTAEDFAACADRIAALRRELDGYAQALHRPQKCGYSLYELMNRCEADRDAAELEPFSPKVVAALDRSLLQEQTALVQRLTAAARQTGHPHGHPLSAIGCREYSQYLKQAVPGAAGEFRSALENLRAPADAFSEAVNCPVSSYDELSRAAALAKELELWQTLPSDWAKAENLPAYLSQVRAMAQHFLSAGALSAELEAVWNRDFLKLDGSALLAEYREAAGKWFLSKMMGVNALYKRLLPYTAGGVSKDDLPRHLQTLADFQSEQAAAEQLFARYGAGLGSLYTGDSTNWDSILLYADSAEKSGAVISRLTGSELFRMQFCGDSGLQDVTAGLLGAWDAMLPAYEAFDGLLSVRISNSEPDWISAQVSACGAAVSHADELKEWITWNDIAADALDAGLAPVVLAYENGMAHEDVEPAFRKAVFRALTMQAIDAEPILNRFSGAVFNEKIAQFRKLDAELTEYTQKEIYCRLAARVPNFAREAAQSSELGILQRAIKSGARGVSIRRLFEQIPNLLPRLCPCMLMSPISAAQYLDPNREPFDIVVFDEASQLPTCKAVGALARGRDAVIVGDPNQMPPTAFFAANAVDEEHPDTEDLESILDDCLALSMPQTHLLWHYRSRHESLIAFSNRRFYENRLYTFPSVNDRETKVRLVHVDGVFDRGRTRQNRAEAEAVVAELQRRCHDPEASKLSVGVVTFNIQQQNLIDDLLTEACKQDAALEAWACNAEEPLFIKNLENVQGDERDAILFSVGFGPDRDGRVSMNFGPLNRDGGWRRLNVAISRARCEMTVYATLLPEQIDLTRTTADGVAALKGFLEYAAGKELSQDEQTVQVSRAQASGIADAICAALAEKGYAADKLVGHSEYRIDVGVIDPENPERYLLGILLDGSSYAASRTTRDRELAQVSVLKGLGWNLLRVWAMDWWDNSGKELNRIFRELERLEAAQAEPVQPEPPAASEEASAGRPLLASAVQPAPKQALPAEVYRAAVLPADCWDAEKFLDDLSAARIGKKIRLAVEQEAPVSESVLTRRVLQSFGIARCGSRLQARMTAILRSLHLKTTVQAEQVFYWNDVQDPDTYPGLRADGENENSRDAREVPVQEIVNALCCILYDQISMPKDDLIRETARLLGYARMGSNVAAAVEAGLAFAQEKSILAAGQNGALVLTGSGSEKARQILARFETE